MKTKPSQILKDSTVSAWATLQDKWDFKRECPRCHGTRLVPHWNGSGENQLCKNCDDGYFKLPILSEILDGIASIYKKKIKLRSSRPQYGTNTLAHRCYYVWRIIRFEGGIDVTMPMMASMELGEDPYRKELDAIASAFARWFCGTDMAAALRWGPLMGYCTEAEAEKYMETHPQPATAQSCGPVLTAEKPVEEVLELH